MKKKSVVILIVAVLLLAILIVPIPVGIAKDGGTRVYKSLTYTLVRWNRLTVGEGYSDTVYKATRLYFGKDATLSMDELWKKEEDSITKSINGTISEITDSFVDIKATSQVYPVGTRIRFSRDGLSDIGAKFGDKVVIFYKGSIAEPYPFAHTAVGWEKEKSNNYEALHGKFLDASEAKKCSDDLFSAFTITEVFDDCYIGKINLADGTEYTVKLNTTALKGLCIGDTVSVKYKNGIINESIRRIEATLSSLDIMDDMKFYKPVIYLYPEAETDVTVKLDLDGKLTCTYPTYPKNGWRVTASPNGTLTDKDGKTYSYLYWEGEANAVWDMTKGFCVAGKDTATFLEKALADLGLTRREANEFIVYWLPLMQENPYNLISFQTKTYEESARLTVTPTPDTTIRVFMTWEALDAPVEIEPQTLSAPERIGFTIVEWGGTELN